MAPFCALQNTATHSPKECASNQLAQISAANLPNAQLRAWVANTLLELELACEKFASTQIKQAARTIFRASGTSSPLQNAASTTAWSMTRMLACRAIFAAGMQALEERMRIHSARNELAHTPFHFALMAS
jgi:hypothetical protein